MKKLRIDTAVPEGRENEFGCSLFAARPVISSQGIHARRINYCGPEDLFQEKQKGYLKAPRNDGEKFIFTAPAERKFELSQFAEDIINKRISKTELPRLSQIYTIATKFADEVAATLLKEEASKATLYSKSQVRRRVNAFTNLRIRTWIDYLRRQDLGLAIDSPETFEERNEDGDLVGFSQKNDEWIFLEDRINPFHQDPHEVLIALERDQILEKALKILAERHTRRAREYMAIVAVILGRPELGDWTILASLAKTQKNTLTFHAIRTLATIIKSLYPVEETRKSKIVKVKRTSSKVLKMNMRKTHPLWRGDDFKDAA